MTRLPDHAYVPGKTVRHADGAFDDLLQGVTAGMSPDQLAATDAFRAGIVFLDAGYFWEAHEMFEPIWMVCPPGSAERQLMQGLIQYANAGLKNVMARPRAALRLCDIAQAHLMQAGGADMPVDVVAIRVGVDSLRARVNLAL